MDTLYRRWLIMKMIPRYSNSITTSQIADRLNAETLEAKSVRTIQRDLEELSGIFPITYEKDGRIFRWSWMEEAPLCNIPIMDPQTALTFSLAGDHLASLLPKTSLRYLEPYFASAKGILDGNPDMPLAQWRDKVRIVSRNLQMESPRFADMVTDKVYEALLKEQRITVLYRPRYEDEIKVYSELNPLGMVFVDNLIYLVATVGDYLTPLQFLLHRMEKVSLLEKRANIPAGFTLQGYIESGEFSYPLGKETIRLKAVFDGDASAYLRETPLPGTISLVDGDEDTVLLEAEVLDSIQLRWWLRGFGSQVEVLEPAELRAEFKEMAKVLRSIYLLNDRHQYSA
jgi:predicted DNA-binding transcriptional regulator YafY